MLSRTPIGSRLALRGLTGRNSMSLLNARYYERGHFFWDERADTLEDQVLQPIQNDVEMGLTLDQAVAKVAATEFYPPLFSEVFGDESVTAERMSQAMSQFVRSMVSYQSKFDRVQAGTDVFTDLEARGQRLFGGGNANGGNVLPPPPGGPGGPPPAPGNDVPPPPPGGPGTPPPPPGGPDTPPPPPGGPGTPPPPPGEGHCHPPQRIASCAVIAVMPPTRRLPCGQRISVLIW